MAKPFQVLFDYSDVATLKKFALSNERVRCVMGPFGCIRGDQKIITEEGLVRIADINRPMRVLSWNKKKGRFQLSQSGGSFPKGKDYLYRVATQQGDTVVAGHHRVLCADGKYQQVQNLHCGTDVSLCSPSHSWTKSLINQLSFLSDGLRSLRTHEDWMGCYAESARQYGQQLLMATGNDQVFFQELNDVRQSHDCCDSSLTVGVDGQEEQIQEHTRQYLSFFQKRIGDFFRLSLHRIQGAVDYVSLQPSGYTSGKVQEFLQSLKKLYYHYKGKLFLKCFHSYSSSISNGSILSIDRLNVKEVYWDLQVLDTNNYVTEDGMIHHNSGKSSACVMEIIRRAHQQAPGPDGIRRSRWAVVRNSYTQLKDTTIRTFQDWFPPKLFGEYRVTDHMYIITKFPGVHLEVLFRALDRPDQVSNLLSLEVTGAWFNEVREIPKTIIEAMDGRIGRYPSDRDGMASWYGTIMDTNPPDEDSYIYKMFEVIRPEGWKMFKQPSGLSVHAENTKHLPKNYYINLAKGKDEMYKRIYIDGQYGYMVSGKPVFASFKDNIHVAPNVLEPQKGLDVIVGFDFGLQPACSIGQVSPFGQLRILDELVSDGMGLRQFCANQLIPLLRRKYFGMNIMGFGDPSGASRMPTDESTCFEVLSSKEIGLSDIVPAPTNAIMPRIAAVESFLNKMYAGEPGFVLSPNCHFLRKALNGAYHYEKEPKSLGEDYKPMPLKNFASHISDSLQMLCLYIEDRAEHNKRWKLLQGQLKKRPVSRAADSIAGY